MNIRMTFNSAFNVEQNTADVRPVEESADANVTCWDYIEVRLALP